MGDLMSKVIKPTRVQKVTVFKENLDIWNFPSSSSNKEWTVKYHKNRLSCDCPSAIYKMTEDRVCKHIQYLLDQGIPLYKFKGQPKGMP
jgi:hypothetical protein